MEHVNNNLFILGRFLLIKNFVNYDGKFTLLRPPNI